MKEETGFAVIVTSQIPVFIGWRKLALVSPDTGITPPGAAESKGLQLFFTVYPRGTQACGVRQKSYLFLCHFIRPHKHTIRVRTHKHTYPKKLFTWPQSSVQKNAAKVF